MSSKSYSIVERQCAADDHQPVLSEASCCRSAVLRQSNAYISMKYRSNALSMKVQHYALMKIQRKEYEEKSDGIYVTMKAQELRKISNIRGKSFYEMLKVAAVQMTGTVVGLESEKDRSFQFMTLVNKATYENGFFSIRYPLELKSFVVDIQKNYTQIPSEFIYAMNRAYSQKLYQLLKRQCYYPVGYAGERNYIFEMNIGVSELKISLGVVDTGDIRVRNLLQGKKVSRADFDAVIKKLSKDQKTLESWADFNRRCLCPAVEEVNSITDINVSYSVVKNGRGGKITDIVFRIELKDKSDVQHPGADANQECLDSAENVQEAMQIFVSAMNLLKSAGLTADQVLSVCVAAEYRMDKIKKAYDVFLASNKGNGRIENPTGWFIDAVKNGYEVSKPVNDKMGIQRGKDLDSWLKQMIIS